MRKASLASLASLLACGTTAAQSGSAPASTSAALPSIEINASADASAQGLSPAYPGGQVARGGRAGILGTRDNMETPFSITSYTNELIQDKQARSVGEVLQNDPGVRTARGFGNFQESYFIRGFILNSDDVAYNGLYSLLPRQYIATELFERVEVLRGASAFLSGANPGGGGIGGAINLLPKRAPDEDLARLTVGAGSGVQGSVAADIARRFGADKSTGVRLNVATRRGDTSIDDEQARLDLVALGVDWRSATVRLSGDVGWQDNRLKRTRPNVTLAGAVTDVPDAPDSDANFAQPWTYSDERDVFGTLRGEVDITPDITAWAAYGARRSDEANSLANLDVVANSGAVTTSRFDNTREDKVDTGELGLRGTLRTGPIGHEWVISASYFSLEKRTAYVWDFFNTLATDLYDPVSYSRPPFSGTPFSGNDLDDPAVTGRTRLRSVAIGDTLSMVDDTVLLTLGVRRQTLDIRDYAFDTGAATVYDESRTSPMAGVVWKVSPRFSLYANYIEGLTQGESAAVANPPPSNLGAVMPPYVSKQKEVGLKYDGGRLGGGVALFSTTKPRYLVEDTVFTDEGEDRHRGVEVTVFGRATDDLRLLGGATWLDAEQRKTGDPATEGRRVIGVPRLQANVGAEWDVPAVDGLSLDARAVHTRSSHADAANTLEVPGWTRLDIGARYFMDVGGKLLTLRARIDNVTDRDHWSSVGGFPGSGYLNVGAPRTFSLSASVDL